MSRPHQSQIYLKLINVEHSKELTHRVKNNIQNSLGTIFAIDIHDQDYSIVTQKTTEAD